MTIVCSLALIVTGISLLISRMSPVVRSPHGASGTREVQDKWPLVTGDALVDHDFNLDPTVLGPPGLSLVRCRWSVLAHRTRCYDMPHRHAALLDQISDHR